MTCHAVRFKCSTAQSDNPDVVPSPEPPELENVLPDRVKDNVLGKLDEVLPEQAQPFRKLNTDMDGSGTEYLQGTRRVDGAHDKATVIDEFEKGAVVDAEWYRGEWHECDHDEPVENRTGCSWTTEREGGSVPSEV